MTRSHLFLVLLVGLVAAPALGQEAPRYVERDGPALLDEPPLLMAAIDFAGRFSGGDTDGFYPNAGGMISGSGWISGGPGYRRRLFRGRVFADRCVSGIEVALIAPHVDVLTPKGVAGLGVIEPRRRLPILSVVALEAVRCQSPAVNILVAAGAGAF